MTIDDWLDMVQVSRPLLTPDGHRVLYSRQVSNWEDNRVETTWWLSDATEGPGRPFLRTEARDVQMSPDGRLVSFIRGQDGEDQVFLMSLSGGEAWPLTEHETDIRSHEWSGDGRFIVFLAPEPRDEEDPDPDAGDDAVLVDEGPNTRTLGRWQNLWRVDVEAGGSERLTDADLHIFEYEVSPTGDRASFVGRASGDRNDIDHNEIYLVAAGDGEVRRLTDDRAVQDMLRWAPEGDRLAFKADDERTWTAKRDRLWVLDLPTGEIEPVSEAFTEGRINQFWWGPEGDRLILQALVRTDTNLFEVLLESGEIEQRTHAVGTLAVASFSRDLSRIAFTFQDHGTPPDIYVAGTTSPPASTDASLPETAVRLTQANPWVESELSLASMEVIRWVSEDGLEVEGLLHTPPQSEAGPLPLMLHIHGGPAGFFN
ncbi:MAG: hypothetical protein HKO77_03415, partial [Gemmatimonadetes bacterium]|nr:hypothetical protein [Gemmatimonadota bacterium]